MFSPPLAIRMHEASHAAACVALGLTVEKVSVETLTPDGHVKHKDMELSLLVRRFIRLAGPLGQQIYVPESVKDRYLSGELFGRPIGDREFYATSPLRLNTLGWVHDLNECYTSLRSDVPERASNLSDLAAVEREVRTFLKDPAVQQFISKWASRMTAETRFSEETLTALNAEHDTLKHAVPARIAAAYASGLKPSQPAN